MGYTISSIGLCNDQEHIMAEDNSKIKKILRTLRVKQWVKNSFIFFPLIFSGRLFTPGFLMLSVKTFLGFCLAASSVYILNDFFDHKRDHLHPKKSKHVPDYRKINKACIGSAILLLLAAGLMICQTVNTRVTHTVIAYIAINIVYNLAVKNIVILDVLFIALGFQLRIWAGSMAIGVFPSAWLQMCVFLLALFLGFTKRRNELSILKDRAAEYKPVLTHYTVYLLDQIIIICSTLAIVFYGLYTLSPEIIHRVGSQKMIYSVTFVIYGIFRYLYLVHTKHKGDDPGEILFSDMPFIICMLAWIFYIGILIYH